MVCVCMYVYFMYAYIFYVCIYILCMYMYCMHHEILIKQTSVVVCVVAIIGTGINVNFC